MSEDLVTEVTEATEVTEESIAEPGQATDPVSALTADLQRLQAEYANYKKRVERDRSLAHELAISSVLIELLPVLDDIESAPYTPQGRQSYHGNTDGVVGDMLPKCMMSIGKKQGCEINKARQKAQRFAIALEESNQFSSLGRALETGGGSRGLSIGKYVHPVSVNKKEPPRKGFARGSGRKAPRALT